MLCNLSGQSRTPGRDIKGNTANTNVLCPVHTADATRQDRRVALGQTCESDNYFERAQITADNSGRQFGYNSVDSAVETGGKVNI